MTLEELGALLRAERERRGLSIEDVSAHLKISVRKLRALEDGDASAMPHPAYVKGFVRSYATYLGMATSEVVEAMQVVSSHMPETAEVSPGLPPGSIPAVYIVTVVSLYWADARLLEGTRHAPAMQRKDNAVFFILKDFILLFPRIRIRLRQRWSVHIQTPDLSCRFP